jgi:hypothetical protein
MAMFVEFLATKGDVVIIQGLGPFFILVFQGYGSREWFGDI